MKSWAQGVQGTPVLYMANWASRPPRIWECPQVVSGRVSYVTWTLWTLWPKHSEHNWRLTVQQAILLRLLPQPAPLFFFFFVCCFATCWPLRKVGHKSGASSGCKTDSGQISTAAWRCTNLPRHSLILRSWAKLMCPELQLQLQFSQGRRQRDESWEMKATMEMERSRNQRRQEISC